MAQVREILFGKGYDPYREFEALIEFDKMQLLEFNGHGFNSETPQFAKYIEQYKPSLIIEVGTWMGASARHMATLALAQGNIDVEVVCVDTWLGSVEHWHGSDMKDKLRLHRPVLFECFMSNVVHKNLQKYITPFPIDSINGAHVLKRYGIVADMIYIDAGHEYESVSRDVELYKELVRPGGLLMLDDSHYEPIQRAANELLPGHIIDGSKIIWTR